MLDAVMPGERDGSLSRWPRRTTADRAIARFERAHDLVGVDAGAVGEPQRVLVAHQRVPHLLEDIDAFPDGPRTSVRGPEVGSFDRPPEQELDERHGLLEDGVQTVRALGPREVGGILALWQVRDE